MSDKNKRNQQSSGGIERTLVSEKVFRAGYVIRHELWAHSSTEKPTPMTSAYTPDGAYIGQPKDARYLVVKRGIRPQLRTPKSSVCSIGYNAAERKWYGWSHRAIYGFGVGARVTKGMCGADYLPKSFVAKTLTDAKRMAEAFAQDVS